MERDLLCVEERGDFNSGIAYDVSYALYARVRVCGHE